MKFQIFIFCLISIFSSCNSQRLVSYDLERLIKEEKIESKSLKDSVDQFIVSVLSDKRDEMSYHFFPEITSIDVSSYISKVDGNSFLVGVGSFVRPFSKSSEKLLALGVFMRKNYKLRKASFDNILRSCIALDGNNFEALYLLSELRYEAGYVKEAKYVLEVLNQRTPLNSEVKQLIARMNKTEAAKFYSFEKFLQMEAFYGD